MNLVCKNCNNHFNGKFCNQCGQSADTFDINAHFIWHDIKISLLHIDYGVPFTLKALFTKPGKSIRDYINGKRVKYIKPIAFVLILAGAYGLLYQYYKIDISTQIEDSSQLKPFSKIFNEWLGNNYAIAQLIFLPILTLSSFVVFWRSGLNVFKHLVLNAYLTGQRLFVAICLFPILYYTNGTPYMTVFNYISFGISGAFLVWTYMGFFDYLSKFKVFWLSIATYLLYVGIAIGLGVLLEYMFLIK